MPILETELSPPERGRSTPTWPAWIASIVLSIACSGKSTLRASLNDGGTDTAGATSGPDGPVRDQAQDASGLRDDVSGPSPLEAGHDAVSDDRSSDLPTPDGEPTSPPESPCDTAQMLGSLLDLPHAIRPSMIPQCIPAASPSEATGELRFDAEGRLVDDTGYLGSGEQKSAWLASLSDGRWTCWAGQTIRYVCLSPAG